MGVYSVLTLFTCVIFIESKESTWNMPIGVRGYNSYLDVSPFKYDIPSGTSRIIFTLQTGKSGEDCADKKITILGQYGSLPLVKETDLTFPDNFMVDEPAFKLVFSNATFTFLQIMQPPPGPLFVIAYTDTTEKVMRPKGLHQEDNCVQFFTSRVDYDDPDDSSAIDFKEKHEVTIGDEGTLFRFEIPVSTMHFQIQVIMCQPAPCNLTLTYLPYNGSVTKSQTTCSGHANDCVLHVVSPPLSYMQYLELRHGMMNQTQKITFLFLVAECSDKYYGDCVSLPKLDRLEYARPFSTTFWFLHNRTFFTDLMLAPVVVIPFEIVYPTDVGGTLGWQMLNIKHGGDDKLIVQVCGALLYNYLPDISSDFDLCSNISFGIKQNLTMASSKHPRIYVPYPKVGIWHIVLQATCFSAIWNTEVVCPTRIFLNMTLNIQPCLDNGCTDKGTCMTGSFSSDPVYYSACRCEAKYKGYGCTDDTSAQSVSEQLAAAYLLTMSNLFFIPAVIIAAKRRFIVEAFVYFYNMFFSTFYHACDGIRLEKYRLCIIQYDVLQIADFFGSACSLWFTILAMACIRYKYINPLLHTLGPFLLLIGVVYDRTSLYVIAVPVGCGVLVIAISWGQKMYKRKKLYPSKRRYILFLLPGLILAATGATVFSFFETENNYRYLHSLWHMLLSLSICFFLPPYSMDEYGKILDIQSNSSNQLLMPATNESCTEPREETNAGFVSETP